MSYDLGKITDIEFEELVCDLLQKHFDVKLIESFKSGKDGGIDLRYTKLGKNTIIQCKHFLNSKLSDLKHILVNKELPKVKLINPQRYILVTTIRMSPQDKSALMALMTPYIKKSADIIAFNDIQNLLRQYEDVVRRHFKLWYTSSVIMDELIHRNINRATFEKSKFLVSQIEKKLPKWVYTKSFDISREMLEKNKSIIISGNAGIGKTTLAEMLIYHYYINGFTPIEITNDIAEARSMFNSDEKQIFYYDDFLGRTFSNPLAKNEDSDIINFIKMVAASSNKLFVLTTREHILENAVSLSEKFSLNNLSEHKYILELNDFSNLDKAKILYTHLFFSTIDQDQIKNLLQDRYRLYSKIIKHPNFSPRIVEWMTNSKNIGSIAPENYFNAFYNNLKNPRKIWEYAFTHEIHQYSRNLLLLMYLEDDVDVEFFRDKFIQYHSMYCKKYNCLYSPTDYTSALKELDGSFISISGTELKMAQYHDPSISDFIENYLLDNKQILQDLMNQIWDLGQIKKLVGLLMVRPDYDLWDLDFSYLETSLIDIAHDCQLGTCYTFPDALATIIKVNNVIKSKKLSKILAPKFESLMELKLGLNEDFDQLVAALVNATHIAPQEQKKYIRMLRTKIFNILDTNDVNNIFDFQALYEMDYIGFFTDRDLGKIRKYLKDFMKYNALDECIACSDSYVTADSFIEMLINITDGFEIDVNYCGCFQRLCEFCDTFEKTGDVPPPLSQILNQEKDVFENINRVFDAIPIRND